MTMTNKFGAVIFCEDGYRLYLKEIPRSKLKKSWVPGHNFVEYKK